MPQDQVPALDGYIQHLERQPAFQQGLKQALGEDPRQALSEAYKADGTTQTPRVPIKGKIRKPCDLPSLSFMPLSPFTAPFLHNIAVAVSCLGCFAGHKLSNHISLQNIPVPSSCTPWCYNVQPTKVTSTDTLLVLCFTVWSLQACCWHHTLCIPCGTMCCIACL